MKRLIIFVLITTMLTLFLSGAFSEELIFQSMFDALQVPMNATNVVTQSWTESNGTNCYYVYYEETSSSSYSSSSQQDGQSSYPNAGQLADMMSWVEQQVNTMAGEPTVNWEYSETTVYQTTQSSENWPYDASVFQTAQPADDYAYEPAVYQTAQPPRGYSSTSGQSQKTNVWPAATQAPVSSQQTEYQWTGTDWAPAATTPPAAAPTLSTGDYTTFDSSMQEQKLLNLLNEDRAKNGLPPLTLDPELSKLARLKSNDMNSNNYFDHESPTYGYAADMLDTFNYDYNGVGENIAHYKDVEKAEAALMSSEGHRRNILGSQWDKVGIGIAYDKDGNLYITQLFAR